MNVSDASKQTTEKNLGSSPLLALSEIEASENKSATPAPPKQSPYPIELQAPDIKPYALGNTGTPYVWRFEGKKAGPHLMICALTHGNEISGAIALIDLLEKLKTGQGPQRGSITLSFNNIAAFEKFTPEAPYESRFAEEDFNRVWSAEVLDGPRDSIELQRARALRPFVDQADLLLDLHSMSEKCVPMMVCGWKQKGMRLSQTLGAPQYLMADRGHSAGTRLIDYAAFNDDDSARNAVLLEAGQHWEASALVCVKDVIARFLKHGDIGFFAPENWQQPSANPQWEVRVTEAVEAQTDEFQFAHPFKGFEKLALGDLIGTELIEGQKREVRAPYNDCMLVMPAPGQAKKGTTAVRLGLAKQLE
jgi:predicted deacylase